MRIFLKLILPAMFFLISCEDANIEMPLIFDSSEIIASQDIAMTQPARSNSSRNIHAQIGIFNNAKKFIKDARIYFQVDNIDSSINNTKKLLLSFKAYIESETENIRQNKKIIDLKIKVPSKSFEKFLDSLALITGDYESRSVNLRDVTDQYTDTDVRIGNKKKIEKQYLELLKKASKIEDLLSIEENLGKVREEIEAAERKLLQLNKDIDYSTVLVKFYKYSPTFKYQNSFNFNFSLLNSVRRGWYGMLRTIFFLFSLWPLIVIIIPIYYFIRKYLNKRKLRNKITV